MTELTSIEAAAKKLSDARKNLADELTVLQDGIEALKRTHMAAIKRAVALAADRHETLRSLVESAPDLFVRPKTMIFHGIKVGFRKGSGGIDWDDDEKVAALIHKHLPDQEEALVKTTHKPIAKALQNLDVADLKRIGCTVEGTSDVVVVKATDSEIDKAVNALLKAAVDEAEEKAAA